MTDAVCINENYSTIRLLTKETPTMENNRSEGQSGVMLGGEQK